MRSSLFLDKAFRNCIDRCKQKNNPKKGIPDCQRNKALKCHVAGENGGGQIKKYSCYWVLLAPVNHKVLSNKLYYFIHPSKLVTEA